MMHFIDAAADGELLAELKDAGVLTPDVVDRIHREMGRPETGTLSEFLLAGASCVPEKPWLYWLIRRHDCHRFGRVLLHKDARESASELPPRDDNLPYRRCADGALMVALLRPDLRAATAQSLAPRRVHWAAATLSELGDLRASWHKARSCGNAGTS
jgi:hypothetical protein